MNIRILQAMVSGISLVSRPFNQGSGSMWSSWALIVCVCVLNQSLFGFGMLEARRGCDS